VTPPNVKEREGDRGKGKKCGKKVKLESEI